MKLNKASKNIDDKNEEISGLLTRYSEISKKNKELEFDIEDIRKLKEVLDVKYKNNNEEVNTLENEREELLNKINKLENDNKIIKNQIQNSKRNFNELEEKKAIEIDLLTKDIETIRLKERELGNRLIFFERDQDSNKEENRRLKKELENTKSDLDQIMKMMENYESKVQFLQKKEENMQILAKQNKEKIEDALIQRDRALLKEENYQKTIDHLTETNRQEISSLREQQEKSIENLKLKHKNAVESRNNEIKTMTDDQLKQAVQIDRLQKDNKNLKNELNKLNSILKENSDHKDDKVDDYLKRIHELETKIIRIEHENTDRIRNLTKEKAELEQSCRQYQNSFEEIKTGLESIKSQNASLTAENQSVRAKLSIIQKEKQNFTDEISNIKKSYETQIGMYADDYSFRIRDMESKLEEGQKKEKITREKTMEVLKTHERVCFKFEMISVLGIVPF